VVDDRVVLLHPHGGEAEILAADDFLQGIRVVVAALDRDEADLESCH
jgi:hypothetical protein